MRRNTAIILLIVLAVFLWPHPVHAYCLTVAGCATDTAVWLMDALNTGLSWIQRFVTALLTQLGGLMQSLINLKLTYGGPTVYFVWKMFRDMCNALFVVMFILVAFGTIFNVVWKNPFMYSSALKGVIIAALLINFSLAIGQTIVWAGNEASMMVIKLFPKGDIGAQVATKLSVPAVVVAQVAQAIPAPVVADIPTDQLGQGETATLNQWFATSGTVRTSNMALQHLKSCLALGTSTISTCYQESQRLIRNEMALAGDKQKRAELCIQQSAQIGRPKSQATCYAEAGISADLTPVGLVALSPSEIIPFYKSWGADGGFTAKFPPVGKDAPANLGAQMGLFVNNLLSVVLLLTLVLSFLCVLIFMVVRLPAIWFLLATSAIAFFTLAMPGNGKFKEWFNNLLGWCIFSPLYLFVIYIGMYFLSQQGSLMASLSDPQLPFFAGTFGSILFFFIAGFIFIYGAKWATSTAFGLSAGAGAAFGAIGSRLGVSAETGFGLKTISKKIGATGAYESLKATGVAGAGRVGQAFRPITQRLAGATYDEKLARMQQRYGVAGGAQQVAKLTGEQVKKEQTTLDQLSWDMDREDKAKFMRSRMNSVNKPEALAARENLMRMGQLNEDEIKQTMRMYPEGIAQAEFEKRSKRAGTEERAKGYNEDLDALNLKRKGLAGRTGLVTPIFSAIQSPEAKKEFLRVLAQRDPELASTLGTGILTRAEAYNAVVTSPERLMELPDSYHAGGPETDAIRDQLIAIFPDPGPTPANAKEQLQLERREKFKESLINKGGAPKMAFIRAIMP